MAKHTLKTYPVNSAFCIKGLKIDRYVVVPLLFTAQK